MSAEITLICNLHGEHVSLISTQSDSECAPEDLRST